MSRNVYGSSNKRQKLDDEAIRQIVLDEVQDLTINGVQGPQGIQGIQGVPGEQGPQGIPGNDGVDGSSINSYPTSNLPSNNPDGTIAFDSSLNVPVYFHSGKWYKVADNAEVSDNILDLFIFAGQSNMDGRATVVSDSVDRTSTLFYKETATSSSSTIDSSFSGLVKGHTSNEQFNKLCPVISFHDRAKLLQNNYPQHLAIMKFSHGGTSLAENWNTTHPNNYMFSKFKEAIDDAKSKLTTAGYTYNVKGMVWLQGETDSQDTTNTSNYQTNMNNFISEIRTHLNLPNLPVVLVGIKNNTNATTITNANTINTSLKNIANTDRHIGYVFDNSWGQRDNLHYNTSGQQAIGVAVADEMINAIAGIPFNPFLSNDLLGWYAMDDITTIEVPGLGTRIQSWNDKTNNRHLIQNDSTLTPGYLNSSSVKTNGSTYLLATNQAYMYNNQGGIEVFMVCKSSTTNSGTQFLLCEGGNAGTSQYSFTSSDTGVKAYIKNDNNTEWLGHASDLGTSVDIRTNSYEILSWKDSGTNMKARVNAEAGGSGSNYTRSGTISLDNICLGGVYRNSFAGGSEIDVKEIIICNILSDDDRYRIEGYLAHKHGITSSLPLTHVYKNVAP